MQLVQRLLADDKQYGLDVFEVAEGLRKLGHAVTIRNALGGGGGNECLRNLRHRFLSCRMQGTVLVLGQSVIGPASAHFCKRAAAPGYY